MKNDQFSSDDKPFCRTVQPFGVVSGLMGEASIPSLPVIPIDEFKRLNLLTAKSWQYIEKYNLLPIQYTLHYTNTLFTHKKCSLPEFVREKPVHLPYKPLEVKKTMLPFMPVSCLSETYHIDPYKITQAILDKHIPAFKIEGFGIVVPYSETRPEYLNIFHTDVYTSEAREVVDEAAYNCPSCHYQIPITLSQDEYNRQYKLAEMKVRLEKAAAIASAEQLQLLLQAYQALELNDLQLCIAPDLKSRYPGADVNVHVEEMPAKRLLPKKSS